MTADRRSYYCTGPDGLVLTLRVTPKASRTAIAGPMETEDGAALKVAITTTPDKGKANAAVTALFVKAFGVVKRDVTLLSGAAYRRKIIRVDGDPAALAAIADHWGFP
jgi:uncharacterized protein (TIGR00251 family)